MERDGNTWKEMEGVLSTWSLKSCPKKRFEVLLCRAIQRGQSARAAARHEAMKQRLCWVFTFPVLVFCFAPFLSILKLSITSGILCVFHVSNVFTFEFGDF